MILFEGPDGWRYQEECRELEAILQWIFIVTDKKEKLILEWL